MKTLLGFFRMIFFALLTIVGLALVIYYFDLTGQPALLNAVMKLKADLSEAYLPALDLPKMDNTIQVTVVSRGQIEKTNPLEDRPLPIVPTLVITREPPTPEPTFTPVPTATEIPRVDPLVYQTEGMIRLKRLAAALEGFLATNDRVMEDTGLLQDAGWRNEMKGDLAEVAVAGQALATIGRPPVQYENIDTWFVRIGKESRGLQANYLRALKTGSAKDFTAAGDNFIRIKEYLAQAAAQMIAAGWKIGQ